MKKNELKIFQKSFFAIGLGLFYTLMGLYYLGDETGYFFLIIGLISFFGGIGYYFNLKKKEKSNNLESLNKIFYSLLEKNNGKLTLVQFAAATNLQAKESRDFLEKKATEFGTVADVDYEGVITYTFR